MKHPAIPSVIVPDLARLVACPLDVVPTDTGVELRTRERRSRRVASLVPTPSAPELPADRAVMVKALTSLNVHRWLRRQVHAVWRTHILGGDSMAIEIDGGYRALLRDGGGGTGGQAATRLKQALHLLQHVALARPKAAGPLIELTETRAARARVKIELTGPLRIGFANELRGVGERNRRLVPLPRSVPLFGDLPTRRHSAACAFEMLLLDLIRKRAKELLEGAIYLAPQVLHAQGEIVGLHAADVEHLMELWSDGPDSLLTHLGDDEYELGPTRELMRQFLLEGAQASRRGTKSKQGRRT